MDPMTMATLLAVGKKAVGGLLDKYLPQNATPEEKEQAHNEAMAEYALAIQDVQGARGLAMKESESSPPWTKVLTVTHRPIWSFVILGLFVFTMISESLGLPKIELTAIHKDIMQTVIIFYFGGRSIEKTVGLVKGV